MTADERFAEIWHKIERANRHIADLDAALRAFIATEPYKVDCRRDAQTRKPIYFVRQVEPAPMEITLIFGDAIQNLRAALDHLAQQLYLVGTGSDALASHTSFFIAPSVSEFNKHLGNRVKGMRQDAVGAIRALEPYKDGKGHQLWVLHSLNIIDKHRALVACGGSFQSLDIIAAVLPAFPQNVRDLFKAAKTTLFMRAADRLCPLKAGDELFIGTPDDEFNPDLKFHLAVALNEPAVVEPGPMHDVVRVLAASVTSTVKDFKPFLM